MARSAPYQPFLLRLIHGISGFLAIAAVMTGFWVYDIYDGRFGKLSLPPIPDIQGIHGTFGLFFLLSLPALAIYSFYVGYRKLIQADFASKLFQQVGKPMWWMNLQRITNTAMLLAATFAVITGRMMKEAWLPAGELYHVWYSLHLTAWLVMVLAIALHLLMSAKVGGTPLLMSMMSFKYRPEESPKRWWSNIRTWMNGVSKNRE